MLKNDPMGDSFLPAGIRSHTCVDEWMESQVPLCRLGDTLAQATRTMLLASEDMIVVVDRMQRVVGMLHDRDVAIATYVHGRTYDMIYINDAMRLLPTLLHPNQTVGHAEDLMHTYNLRALPVVDEFNRPVGLLTFERMITMALETSSHPVMLRRMIDALGRLGDGNCLDQGMVRRRY